MLTGFQAKIKIAGKSVSFNDKYLHVELDDGRIISTPMSWYKELQDASFKQLTNYNLICNGTGVEWPDIDHHLSIESMILVSSQRNAA